MQKRQLRIMGLFIGLFASLLLHAQDIHFSQFYASPLTLNPALTGNIESSCRAVLNVRDQWRTSDYEPFTTISASYEKKGFLEKDNYGFGAVLVQDELPSFSYSGTRSYLSGAYHKNMGLHRLSAGLQVGLIYRNLADNKTYPVQYERLLGDYNSNLNNGEGSPSLTKTSMDFNVGIEWMANYDFLSLHGGISSFHLMRPDLSFYGGDKQPMNRLWIITAGAAYKLSEEWELKPNIIYMYQTASNKLHFGGGLEKKIEEGNWRFVNFSAYLRTSGAAIAIFGMGYRNFDFGFSYDFATKENIAGAFELSIIFNCNFDPELPDFYIPCNRY